MFPRVQEHDLACGQRVEEVQISGHIIDSLILPKILDCITAGGGSFRIKRLAVGQAQHDPSSAVVEIIADDRQTLQRILAGVAVHGAVPTVPEDCSLALADREGVFPEGFYSTTNQRTEVRLAEKWLPVANQEMDCGIVVDVPRAAARCLPMTDIRPGDAVVIGREGVRLLSDQSFPPHSPEPRAFEFMGSDVSSEKPKAVVVRQIARLLADNRGREDKTAIVGGPAIVHSGSGRYLADLIRGGYVDLLLAGNALAAHDVEQAMFGTSLGVSLDGGQQSIAGHEHHLRAINRIRRSGGIRRAVRTGVLTSGIMYECTRRGTDFVLAGSIRDDGPLPEVVLDVLLAQKLMRQKLRGVTFCLMIATTLHSVAVGNLLPAWVKVICVDINPSTIIKLSDRGSNQTQGLVTDVEPFMRELLGELSAINPAAAAAK